MGWEGWERCGEVGWSGVGLVRAVKARRAVKDNYLPSNTYTGTYTNAIPNPAAWLYAT